MPHVYVLSSNGTLCVDIETGKPDPEASCYTTPAGEEGDLRPIVRFDFDEWRRAYPNEKLDEVRDIDILDLGYWLDDGTYEPPVEDWRKEFRHLRY